MSCCGSSWSLRDTLYCVAVIRDEHLPFFADTLSEEGHTQGMERAATRHDVFFLRLREMARNLVRLVLGTTHDSSRKHPRMA